MRCARLLAGLAVIPRGVRTLIADLQAAARVPPSPTLDWRDDRCVVRVALCGLGLGLAIVLAAPWPTFPLSVSYRLMAQIMGELGWAALFGVQGLLGLAALRWPSYLLVQAACLTAGVACGLMALCVCLAAPSTTGTVPYAVLAGLAYWSILREAACRPRSK